MAKTYSLIQTVTLTGNASTVTFSNIPQNYTDLIVYASIRGTTTAEYILTDIWFNGSSTGFSSRGLEGTGSNTAQYTNASIYTNAGNGATTTSNTFSNHFIYVPNYTSSVFKSVLVDGVLENNATLAYASIQSGLWSNTSAITSVEIKSRADNFIANSTFTLYGIGAHRASGGTITSDNNFTYHTFTSTGTFTALEKVKNAEVLMVAGGGGGGIALSQAGGGGAGGVVYSPSQTLIAGTSYTCLVGAGGGGGVYVGAPTYYTTYSNGNTSNFGSITAAVGGGYGGVGGGTGANGGSGGGGSQGQLGGGGTALV
jgi:hypothetical protein